MESNHVPTHHRDATRPQAGVGDDTGESNKVVVIGQGYVGLPVAVTAAERGFSVVGFDVDDARIKRIACGDSPVEDISNERLGTVLTSGTYQPTTDPAHLKGFDIAVISVPTPLDQGAPDLTYIEQACHTVGRHLNPGACVILESTTYPGTTKELAGPILEQVSGLVAGADFSLGYSPERIDPGNAVWHLENTPKVVSGIDEASLVAVQGFFDRLVDKTVAVSSTGEAELTKLLENTFRHVNIALVNELAVFAHGLGIDVWEAIDAASTKPFGYMRFTPGPGVGGHCLPIDPSYLSWQVKQTLGQTFRFVELANDVNDRMPEYVTRRLMEGLNDRGLPLKGQRILLLGLSYKANTGDARESPSTAVAAELLRRGATVVAADPHVVDHQVPEGIERVEFSAHELASAAATVMLVDHNEFDLHMVRLHARYVLDTRNVVGSADNVEVL